MFLDEPSVTATENAPRRGRGRPRDHLPAQRRIRAACAGSRAFLVALSARSKASAPIPSSCMAPPLGGTHYAIQPDHIEVGSLIGLAAVTRSPLRDRAPASSMLRSIRMGFERLGIVCGVEGDDLVVPSGQTVEDP